MIRVRLPLQNAKHLFEPWPGDPAPAGAPPEPALANPQGAPAKAPHGLRAPAPSRR